MDHIKQGARILYVFAAGLLSVWISQRFFDGKPPTDFTVFWEAARATDIYRPSDLPFVYPPSALILFKPFGWLPFYPAYWLWVAISVALFLYACRGWLGILALTSGAAIQGFILGQVALLLGGAAILAFSLPALWGGVALGIVASIKPQLIFLAPLALLVRRDWQMVKGAAIGFAGMVAASLVLLGPSLWGEWINSFGSLNSAMTPERASFALVTPAGLAYAKGLPTLPALMTGLIVGCAAIVLAARHVEREMLAGLVIAASIVASPYAHLHDTAGVVPAALTVMLSASIAPALIATYAYVGGVERMPFVLLFLLAWLALSRGLKGRTPAARSSYQAA